MNQTWIILKRYVVVSAIAMLLSSAPVNAETYFYHNDHLGTPQALSDGYQQVVWEVDQKPFGDNNVATESVVQNIRFPGQYADVETGLNYNYFRTYDSSVGRYTQSDPIGLLGGLNKFNYVSANPVGFYDPKGLQAYDGQLPPNNIPGGPWTPGNRPGEFFGPKPEKGGPNICQYVPDADNGGPASATNGAYWKTRPHGGSWDSTRYSLSGEPMTAQQAHPGKKPPKPGVSKIVKFIPILAPLFEMTAPTPTRVPPRTEISPYM